MSKMIIFIEMKQMTRFAACAGNILLVLFSTSCVVSSLTFKRVELPPKVIQKIDSLVEHQIDNQNCQCID